MQAAGQPELHSKNLAENPKEKENKKEQHTKTQEAKKVRVKNALCSDKLRIHLTTTEIYQ